ncbi:MAG: hypothetical protein V3T53_01085 [Phycisphaerales bacterium]
MERTIKGILVGLSVCFSVVFITPSAQAQFNDAFIRAVDQNAPGPFHIGTTWEYAYLDLQDALDDAEGDPTITEIWVAVGEYVPSKMFLPPNTLSSTFDLLEDVAVYGGFLGSAHPSGGEDLLIQRDPETNITTLNGDLDGNDNPADFPSGPSYLDNCWHVVRAHEVGASAVINGFTIINGRAIGGVDKYAGGGLLALSASPTVVRCTFRLNSAQNGGGLGLFAIGPPVSTPTYVVNCSFIDNWAGVGQGGGVHVEGGTSITLVNSLFLGNHAGTGGAVDVNSGLLSLMTNCTVRGNSANSNGGGIKKDGFVVVTNSILWENTDGGGMDESAQISDSFGDPPAVAPTYSCIQGCDLLCADLDDHNTGDDPLFCDAVNHNLRLAIGSPCIDAANNSDLPDDVADVDDDPTNNGDPIPWDLDKRLRVFPDPSGTVDMGAYESQHDQLCPADLDDDCSVGASDLLSLLASWGPCPGCAADLDCNLVVGASDLLSLLASWGLCACGTGPGPLTLQEELDDACLTMDDWDDFVAVMTDPESSQEDKDNYLCWMEHYFFDCNRCICIGASGCPGPDPFN